MIAGNGNKRTTIAVFHCWFSMQRGPTTASLFDEFLQEKYSSSSTKLKAIKVYYLKGGMAGWLQQYSASNSDLIEPIQ